MTKLFLKIFIVLTISSSLAFVITLKSLSERTNERDIAVNTAAQQRDSITILNKTIDSLNNSPLISEVVFHARDPKTKDFFTFLKMNGSGKEGYQIITDIRPIDREQFDLIYEVLIDSAADLHFAMENLYGESRAGANQKHSRNKDGSIDFGWFGKNYPKGTNPIKVGVVQQARDYCKFINENNLMGYPPEQRRSRYYSKYWWEKDLNKKK